MKLSRAQVESALGRPGGTRLFLFYGPDEAGSRSFIPLLAAGAGKDAERIDLNGTELRADPARLSDEAASLSLFGTPRYIVVDPAGDECVPAVEALLESSGGGNPVALIGGALKASSKLVKLAQNAHGTLAFQSYVPEGREAHRIVMELARTHGLTMRPELARRIAEATGGNRAIAAKELEKYAIFLDAAPERPRAIEDDVVDTLGAASEEGDLSRLVESVGSGDARMLQSELLRLESTGIEGIPLLRAVLKRMTLLAKLRAEVDAGKSVDAVMASQGKAIFWKEKEAIAAQLGRWPSALIAKSVERLMDADRQVKASGGLGPLAASEELFAICRQAARLR